MLISHKHKFIYTKTVKTASTSVELFFEPACRADGRARKGALTDELVSEKGIVGYCGTKRSGKTWVDHMPARKIKANIGDQIWNDYFKFCVVRNPFDKLVSAFHYYEWLVGRYKGWDKLKLSCAHGIHPARSKDVITRFRNWVSWTFWFCDQRNYFIDGKVCVDFFIRYESLAEDIERVCGEIKFPFKPNRIRRFNSKIRPRHFRVPEYYDAKTIEKVRKRFRFELDHFGYEMPV